MARRAFAIRIFSSPLLRVRLHARQATDHALLYRKIEPPGTMLSRTSYANQWGIYQMIAAKSGPLFSRESLASQLQRTAWLFEGRNSEGEKLPTEDMLERTQVALEQVLLEQGKR